MDKLSSWLNLFPGKKSGARPKTPDLTKFQTDASTENGDKKDDDIEAIINEVSNTSVSTATMNPVLLAHW